MPTKVEHPSVTFISRYYNKTYLIGGGVPVPGSVEGFKRVEFIHGNFTTNDPELIDWLLTHRDYGAELWRADDPAANPLPPDDTQLIGDVRTTKTNVPYYAPEADKVVADNIVE